MGAITDVVKRYVPASYRAMCGVTNSYYSISDLQALADFVQFRIYATVAGVSGEASAYNVRERELLGMLTTLQYIPAAVDYWGDQLSAQQTSGTNEDVTYFDRRPELWKVYEKIADDAAELAAEIGVTVNQVKAVVPKVSYGDNNRGILITTDPAEFPPAYSSDDPNYLVWSDPV